MSKVIRLLSRRRKSRDRYYFLGNYQKHVDEQQQGKHRLRISSSTGGKTGKAIEKVGIPVVVNLMALKYQQGSGANSTRLNRKQSLYLVVGVGFSDMLSRKTRKIIRVGRRMSGVNLLYLVVGVGFDLESLDLHLDSHLRSEQIYSEANHRFDALEARISTLESLKLQKEESAQYGSPQQSFSNDRNNTHSHSMIPPPRGWLANLEMLTRTRWLKPDLMMESGAFKGHSTWVLRQAMPDTPILSLTPRHPEKYLKKGPAYVDGNCTYFAGKDFVDFGNVDWKNVMKKHGVTDLSWVLIFFDDHQNELKRLKQALKAGFKHLIFEDNYDTALIEWLKQVVPTLEILLYLQSMTARAALKQTQALGVMKQEQPIRVEHLLVPELEGYPRYDDVYLVTSGNNVGDC
ncbi:hypothetical protein C5167_004743 [Papaver somniferum]|uniref:Uncharacterized protein n=1 Tax=Papaver somniferum TaxID=3469 RepID=A0A4Y7JCR9_PAPSO|nr:hypothetical protein C5167_004743 [Papaver somniferum]